MLKNKFFVILLALLLSLPVIAEPEEGTEPVNENVIESVQNEDSAVQAPNELISEHRYKQPISKRKIAKKFIFAMFGVLVSSLVIYFGLTIYNRIREGISAQPSNTDRKEDSLETPENLSEAIQTFMEKTKWEG